jgi:hypothetical protein
MMMAGSKEQGRMKAVDWVKIIKVPPNSELNHVTS